MTLVWLRVDQKLIHGQVTVAWAPHLDADAIVVVDPETADDAWTQKAMRLGLPPEVRHAAFVAPEELVTRLAAPELANSRILLIFKDLAAVRIALAAGLNFSSLNLGNQVYPPEEKAVRLSENFQANENDLALLRELEKRGVEVLLQPMPAAGSVRWRSAG